MNEVSKTEPPTAKIGGWLILYIFGLIMAPIALSFILYSVYWPILTNGTWSSLTTQGSELYHALWGPLIILELVGNCLTIIFCLVTLVFIFKKSKYAPTVAISLMIYSLIFVAGDYLLAQLIPAVAVQKDSASTKEIGRTVVGALIWIPYFLKSKRVKALFVN